MWLKIPKPPETRGKNPPLERRGRSGLRPLPASQLLRPLPLKRRGRMGDYIAILGEGVLRSLRDGVGVPRDRFLQHDDQEENRICAPIAARRNRRGTPAVEASPPAQCRRL